MSAADLALFLNYQYSLQSIGLVWTYISDPTIIRTVPVAYGGMEAKIGAKKIAMKKQRPVTIDVSPVAPPSEIPAPDSI